MVADALPDALPRSPTDRRPMVADASNPAADALPDAPGGRWWLTLPDATDRRPMHPARCTLPDAPCPMHPAADASNRPAADASNRPAAARNSEFGT